MNKYTKSTIKYTEGGGGMNSEEGESLKDLVKLYYGETNLSSEEEAEVDELLNRVEESGFLDKCREVARQSEKKKIHIGRLFISKAACMIAVICLSVVLTGGIVYAAVLNHIRSIKVKDMGDHGELDIEYNNVSSVSKTGEFLYYEPNWVPDGYYKDTEYKNIRSYSIDYLALNGDDICIYYSQYTSSSKHVYSTENGKSEKVCFGKYSGEYIETFDSNYLIITDGTYIYSLIAQSKKVSKMELIKMIESINEKQN